MTSLSSMASIREFKVNFKITEEFDMVDTNCFYDVNTQCEDNLTNHNLNNLGYKTENRAIGCDEYKGL
jgi:hypothetical protein